MDDLKNLSDEELIRFRIFIDKEISKRKIRFNVGEIGEKIAIKYFNTTSGLPNLIPAPIGAKNVDALSRDGDRYSIKTVQKAKKTGTIYPDISNKEKQLFEYILIVRINEDYDLIDLHRLSWIQFKQVAAWDIRMNAWYIPITQNRLSIGELIYSKSNKGIS